MEGKMKISQEKEFKPLSIIIESEKEYIAFQQIIDEVSRIDPGDCEFMEYDSTIMAVRISNWLSGNV
jgi:hypothetical protein